ncbi:MAG: hypothetical protein LRY56_02615 [Burkholderiaceae bacterium]|nr:hypothetical protein [Burkholderiaceae bacterium]MCD8536449.1 hypothetical protein [Burkholderiaceae bacterium]
MTATQEGLLLIFGLFGLLALGFPIALALMSSGLIAILAMNGWVSADYLLGTLPYSITAEFAFIVVPLFFIHGTHGLFGGHFSQGI